jgi:TonB family protein
MKHALLFAIAVVMVQASPQLYAQGPHGIRTPQLLGANNKFTTFAPLPGYPLGAEARHLEGNGIFLLHVRSDGSVSRVDIVQSTGHRELDEACISVYGPWRFRTDFAAKAHKVKNTGNIFTEDPIERLTKRWS